MNRTAVVTGAAQGLGWAIAQALAKASFGVIMIDRSEEVHAGAASLVEQGLHAKAIVADLAETQKIPALAAEVLQAGGGRCDVLVNNAGVHIRNNGQRFSFEEVTPEAWDFTLSLNLTAPFLLSRQLLPAMRAQKWGRVINIASRSGRTYTPAAAAHYTVSKHGLIGLTRAIAGEYGTFGITANCIAPGRVETPLAAQATDEGRLRSLKEIPMGRSGEPREIGATAAFLASEDAGFITGAVVDVNGGGFMG